MPKVKIHKEIPGMDIDETGRFVKVYRIEFVIDGKIQDWIDVPEDKFSDSYVAELIKQKVEVLQKLGVVPPGEIELVTE